MTLHPTQRQRLADSVSRQGFSRREFIRGVTASAALWQVPSAMLPHRTVFAGESSPSTTGQAPGAWQLPLLLDVRGREVIVTRRGEKRPLFRLTISPAAADVACEVDARPELQELYGRGRRWRFPVAPQSGLAGEVWVSAFEQEPVLLVGGQLQVTGEQPVGVQDLRLAEITLERNDLDRARMYINSGSQAPSGSFPLSDERVAQSPCQQVTAFQGADPFDSLVAGVVSLRRTVARIDRGAAGQQVRLSAVLQYGGVQLDPGQSLSLETLALLPRSGDALAGLERWADMTAEIVRPNFSRSLVSYYNTWYAYWAPGSRHGTEDLLYRAAQELVDTGFIHYGVSLVDLGVWQNRAAFGEDQVWPNLFQSTRAAMVDRLAQSGVQAMDGGFWGYVSECATLFAAHPEWMVKDAAGQPKRLGDRSWGQCPFPFYALDPTSPPALDWFREQALRVNLAPGTKFFWLDFLGTAGANSGDVRYQDPRLCAPVESYRALLGAIREELGSDCVVHTFSSPTNAILGLVDRVRVASDVGGIDPSPNDTRDPEVKRKKLKGRDPIEARWQHLRDVARNVAAAQHTHGKLWMIDPDPASVGLRDDPATVEEARIRLMVCVNSGSFVTIGDALAHMAPSRQALLKTMLPPYGQAARAIDLMQREVPEIHLLPVEREGAAWHVLSLINWEKAPREYVVDLVDQGLSGPRHALEFWTQAYLGVAAETIRVTVPGRSGRMIRLTPVADRPQVIGTDRHVALGLFEIADLEWDQKELRLSGRATRPRTEPGHIAFAVPESFQLVSSDGCVVEPAGEEVMRGAIDFSPEGTPWSLRFSKRNES